MFPPRIHTPEPIRPARKNNFQMPPVAEHMILESGLRPEDLPRKIIGSCIKRNIPDFEKSSMHGKQGMIKDAALFHGRAFRVGWGPGFTLVHAGTPITMEIQGKQLCKAVLFNISFQKLCSVRLFFIQDNCCYLTLKPFKHF